MNENKFLLRQFLESTLKKITSDKTIAVFMDFDECAVDAHLAQKVTNAYFAMKDWEKEYYDAKTDNSYHGCYKLCEMYTGLLIEDFLRVVESQMEGVNWRPGFVKFWSEASQRSDIELFWVSSGLQLAIQRFFSRRGLNLKDEVVIADVLEVEGGIINRPGMVVGEDEKLEVVNFFRNAGRFNKIITVGHSNGDRHLVSAGDPGYRLAFRDKGALVDIADHIIEDWNWLEVLRFI